MLLRIRYKLSKIIKSALYDALFVLFAILIHINTIYYGLGQRPDITSTLILTLCIYKSASLFIWSETPRLIGTPNMKITSDIYYCLWNIYIFILLFLNYMVNNVSHPIIMVDFAKGLFWGFYISYNYYSKTINDSIVHIIQSHLSNIYLAPWYHSPHLTATDAATEDDLGLKILK